METLLTYLEARRRLIDRHIDLHLPPAAQEPRVVHACMRYSLLGGKRLRPLITLAVAEMLVCPAEKVLPTCVAIECIHTHSLILDDLPCMDDDDYRRGRPTSHKQFGEGIALLAADALLNLAITLLGRNHCLAGIAPETALEIIRESGEAVGTDGMIGGQVADLLFAAAGQGDLAASLEQIHLGKTSRLFRLSARVAALVAGATPAQLEAVTAYAISLGLAFQIVDDILDEAEAREDAGRPRGRGGQPSYVAAHGSARAQALAEAATEQAVKALTCFDVEAAILRALAAYNLARDR
ncbi:MAG: polyprenyl synthetase family protein [Dehalococcoidales bacterium]|nr:polyprenyl synthetase family protein [Dehalococcoidales bacterium]